MQAVFIAMLTVSVPAFESEIISDIVTASTDEGRALEIKNQQFWQPVLDSAEKAKMTSAYTHLSVYEEVESAMSELPDQNDHVRGLLSEALIRLKRADQHVFQQAVESSEVADQQLMAGPGTSNTFSFITGGQNYFAQAIRNFVGGGRYSQRIGHQVGQRQAEVTPMLRGAASVTTNVLQDCREGSKLSFDVVKYDIYMTGVVKTPEIASEAAYKLIDAFGDTRHIFLKGITDTVNSIARDSEQKDADPSAIVTKSLAFGLDPVVTEQRQSAVYNF